MQDCSISIANALEILQSCTKPLIYWLYGGQCWGLNKITISTHYINNSIVCSVRTNHSSGRPRRVKTAQGRVKLTHQLSDRTSANFVWKKHHQPTFHETTATNSHSIRTLNSIPEAAILSLLVHMLSCAWWERFVQFCLVPCNECRQCGIELSNHGPVSRGLPLNGSTAHKPTTTFVVDKQVSDLRCQLETYPWPSPINGGSSGCNLDFAIINTCQGKIISSKKTEHGSVLSSTEAVGDNWACQTHGDSSKLVQFEMETSHVHSKYLIILIKQALFFNSKHSCQVLNEN